MKKTILITGAGSGIGKASAIALAKRGHTVIATTETDEQCNSFKAELPTLLLNITVVKVDITIDADRKKAAAFKPDVLINNAGIGESGSLAEIDLDKVRHNFEVNVFSSFEISQLVLATMLANNKGTVIFVSSLAGRFPITFLGPYSMTKFALTCGATTMRTEIHRVRKNVHITLIEPGAYFTGFNQKNIDKKYVWMNKNSVFYPIIDKLKSEEAFQYKIESKSISSIVNKIIIAAEATKPKLRYSAPWWQAYGVRLLRILGK